MNVDIEKLEQLMRASNTDTEAGCDVIVKLGIELHNSCAALIERIRAGDKLRESLGLMIDCWFDYHDSNSLTQPATARAGIAIDSAIEAKLKYDALKGGANG